MSTLPVHTPWPTAATAPSFGVGLPAQVGQGAGLKNGSFQQVMAGVAPTKPPVVVEEGDTLIGLVKAHYRQNQLPISEDQATRLAHQVAQNNQLSNPDLILPGQKIDFSSLQLPTLNRNLASGPLDINTLPAALALRQLQWTGQNTPPSTDQSMAMLQWRANNAGVHALQGVTTPPMALNGPHPVLDRTLERAVDKGFVPPQDLPAVRDKIMALAQRYNFAPDDFARLTLMESGGMNPQASNGSCHGIIQFCDGANRGAAAVGLKNNPRSILGMGLLQQLDLVDKYFAQAGLPTQGPKIGLDDLYLTVLTPAARQETRPDAALPIAGPQAKALHVGGDARNPITRNSILSGLHALTDSVLGLAQRKTPASRWYAEVANSTAPVQR